MSAEHLSSERKLIQANEQLPATLPLDSTTPLIAIGGLITFKRVAEHYGPLLRSDTSTDLPPKERFIAPVNFGIAEPEELSEHINKELESLYARLGKRMFIVGHSLGGLIATVAALERPDLVRGVVSLGGVHTGYDQETIATRSLRYLLGNPKQGRHLRHDSEFMEKHKERMATAWPSDVPLHLVSTPADVLIVPPKGYDVELPSGQQAEKRLLVPPVHLLEQIIRWRYQIADDVKPLRTWHPHEHIILPRVPEVISYVDASRRGVGFTESNAADPALLSAFEAQAAAA